MYVNQKTLVLIKRHKTHLVELCASVINTKQRVIQIYRTQASPLKRQQGLESLHKVTLILHRLQHSENDMNMTQLANGYITDMNMTQLATGYISAYFKMKDLKFFDRVS